MADGIPSTTGAPVEHTFPKLTPAQLARMAAHGTTRTVAKDEVLADAERQPRVFTVVRGRLVTRSTGETARVIRVVEPGEFTGEMSALAGRRSLVRISALEDGSTLAARSVIMATGVSYRKVAAADLARFVGLGVYYGATAMEAQLCRGEEVAVVGGGNSAGQAAEIVGVEGDGHLQKVILRHRDRTNTETLDCRHLFVMTGADPATRWLDGCVALDEKGFVKTGAELTPEDLAASSWPLLPGRLPARLTCWRRTGPAYSPWATSGAAA